MKYSQASMKQKPIASMKQSTPFLPLHVVRPRFIATQLRFHFSYTAGVLHLYPGIQEKIKNAQRELSIFCMEIYETEIILRCGASVTAWCYAQRSHSASHRGAICTRSLTSKLADSLRLIISWSFESTV